MSHARDASSIIALPSRRRTLPPDSVIFGRSPAMRPIREHVGRIQGSNAPILLQGESGTGKEIVANYLHDHSPWSDGAFVTVCCPAIPGTLLESELFGYEKGAFTGADGSKPGRLERAHRGTLFLDEIGELESGLQAKLLQVLQDGQFSRIGSREDKQIDVRLVCATNRRLDQEVLAGTFRRDLYYRINVVKIELPPLRRRREDIPELVDYFLQRHSDIVGELVHPISSDLMRLFEAYEWPGNIRQLENLIRRYAILATEDVIRAELMDDSPNSLDLQVAIERRIPTSGAASEPPINTFCDKFDCEILSGKPVSLKKLTDDAVTDLERRLILKALEVHRWSRRDTARALSISYRSLLAKMREAGFPSSRNGNGRTPSRDKLSDTLSRSANA